MAKEDDKSQRPAMCTHARLLASLSGHTMCMIRAGRKGSHKTGGNGRGKMSRDRKRRAYRLPETEYAKKQKIDKN